MCISFWFLIFFFFTFIWFDLYSQPRSLWRRVGEWLETWGWYILLHVESMQLHKIKILTLIYTRVYVLQWRRNQFSINAEIISLHRRWKKQKTKKPIRNNLDVSCFKYDHNHICSTSSFSGPMLQRGLERWYPKMWRADRYWTGCSCRFNEIPNSRGLFLFFYPPAFIIFLFLMCILLGIVIFVVAFAHFFLKFSNVVFYVA